MHAETVLLIHHSKPKIAEHDMVLKQGVCSHHDVDGAIRQPCQHTGALGPFLAAGQQRQRQPDGPCLLVQPVGMLARQNFSRGHHGRLPPRFRSACHGQHRNCGLAGADIPLQQAQHALRLGHVGADLRHGIALAAGQRVGQFVFQRSHE